jgi:hypothetical protein
MVAAVAFEYKGEKRIAFPLEEDGRNSALLFCYQVLPETGPRSFCIRDMGRIGFTPLMESREVIYREMQKKVVREYEELG